MHRNIVHYIVRSEHNVAVMSHHNTAAIRIIIVTSPADKISCMWSVGATRRTVSNVEFGNMD